MSFLASPRLAPRPGRSGPPRSPAARSLAARSAAWRPAREQEPGGRSHFYEALDVPADPVARRPGGGAVPGGSVCDVLWIRRGHCLWTHRCVGLTVGTILCFCLAAFTALWSTM